MTVYPLHPADFSMSALRTSLLDGAECRFDPELHVGLDAFIDEPDEERAVREDVAMQVCGSCPVRGTCLEYALRIEPEHGVWAGFTAAEIAVLATARRPREAA